MNEDYQAFLAKKAQLGGMYGFAPVWMPDFLYPFQQSLVDWALRKGRGAIFADCGLGKTICQLVFAENVVRKTNKRVLILTPLAVGWQTVEEGKRFGIPCTRSSGEVYPITVTNYEKLHHFNAADFVGCIADECFSPDTPIEVLSIDNSLELKHIKDVSIGDSIINASGVDHVIAIKKRPIDRAIRLTIHGRKPITCSENHPFFTMHGWKRACHLQAGDLLMEASAAMRLVRDHFYPEVYRGEMETFLRDILLSEMADAPTGDCCESTCSRSRSETWNQTITVAPLWLTGRDQGAGAYCCLESMRGRGRQVENVGNITAHWAQTFRPGRQWPSTYAASGVTPRETSGRLDAGACDSAFEAHPWISHVLQSRYGESSTHDWHRDRWAQSSQSQASRYEEGRDACFARVDHTEVLELGHPDLDRWRDASGKLYFYDLEAARHPSFSVDGILVHNSGILKHFSGATQKAVTRFMSKMPYRLLCTATPSPNDYIELGTSSEALGYLGYTDMLSRFFIMDDKKRHLMNDVKLAREARRDGHMGNYYQKLSYRVAQSIQGWRLKGHAQTPFWQWVCSWARACRKPSDLGFDDGPFLLPPLEEQEHVITATQPAEGLLFTMPAFGLSEERDERKRTLHERCEYVAQLVDHDRPAAVWCQYNQEGDLLEQLIPDAVQVSGSDSDDEKERAYHDFITGNTRVLVTKPKIGAWGLNLQHCAHTVTFSSHSWEQFYQSIRRFWRFGQQQTVHVDIVTTEGERHVRENMVRKAKAAEVMFEALVASMHEAQGIEREKETLEVEVPRWMA